jgi:hypothetical protein
MGKGGFSKRTIYSASRVLITPNYEGHNTSMPLRFLAGASPRPSRSRIIPRSPAPPGPSPESTVSPLEEARSGMSSVNSGPTSQSTFLHRHPWRHPPPGCRPADGATAVISFPHYDQAISSFPNVVFSAALSDSPIYNLVPIDAPSNSVHRAACRPPARD